MLLRFLVCLLAVLATPTWALDVVLKQTGTGDVIEVQANDMPDVYGGDVLIGYDPQFFEVIDADDKKKGTQITAGSFFPEGHYLLDNRIDLGKGEIHFAAALVRPMEDANGDGVIASFRLKARKSGDTVLTLKKAEFGTQEGELYKAGKMELTVEADASGRFVAKATEAEASDETGAALSMEMLLMIVIALLLVVIIVLLVRKK